MKTRLIPDIGAEKATEVYRHCLEHSLATVRQSGLDYRLFLSEAPDDSLFYGETYRLQRGADLGERMFFALRDMLDSGAEAAMIIGTDCLDMRCEHLRDAAAALAEHEMVLLPALDGGYALIGCRSIDTGLFDGVQWSSEAVYRQTLANAAELGYRVSSLESVRDIDTLQDLQHYPKLVDLINPR